MPEAKPYDISKQLVWDEFQRVKANRGAAGVDGESLEAFEKDLGRAADDRAVPERRLADDGRGVATIERALAAIATSHVRAGLASPWSSAIR